MTRYWTAPFLRRRTDGTFTYVQGHWSQRDEECREAPKCPRCHGTGHLGVETGFAYCTTCQGTGYEGGREP